MVIAKALLKLNREGTMQVRRYQTSKLKMNEAMKQLKLDLKNRFSSMSLEAEKHENTCEDEDEVALDNKVEKK